MKVNNSNEESKIDEEINLIDDKDKDNLIIEDNLNKSNIKMGKTAFLKNLFLKVPFVLYFFIIIFFFSLSIIIYYYYFYNNEKPNFKKFDRIWIDMALNDRKYENYLFDNGLEVMLLQDSGFDRDGGALVIERGYLDNPFEEGLSTFITSLLKYLNFDDNSDNIDTLENYFGKFKYGIDEHFIHFKFDILHNGFKRFLGKFSSVLDFKNITNVELFNNTKTKIIKEINSLIEEKKMYINYRENHLLEFFVYGLKNKSGGEILPEGNINKLNDININVVSDYINELINPSKIKIVLFSKYKFSISSKYMKHYFRYLTTIDKPFKNDNQNLELDFNTSQIFYIKANYFESNYIKIIYYINKVGNESFSELYYKQNYFKYISDFISKTKNGTLYSIVKQNVKSIYSETEILFKSKIKFSITLELNNLKNINDIIYNTYRYISKITNETNKKIIQMDRYEELKNIYRNNVNSKEKTFDTIELAYANAEYLIKSKYAQYYYFYYEGVPWNDSINNNNETIPNEVEPYFTQLKPNNSIIILGIREKDQQKITCNKNSKFILNCNYFKNESFHKTTYYDVIYKKDVFNSTYLEECLNEEYNDDFDISFEKNIFKSKYEEPEEQVGIVDDMVNLMEDNDKTLNKFYFKKNEEFRVRRVLIKFNLYHPFLRPNNTCEYEKKCYYFLIMEMFSAIKRKINEELADAQSAENNIYIYQNENNLNILVNCFADKAYNISQIIKHIIYDIDWRNDTDFLTNNEIYKNEVFDDFFNYNRNGVQDISRFYLKRILKINVYNKYEFYSDDFENNYYDQCIGKLNKSEISLKELNSFIVHGYIYGFYEKEEAKEISDLFNITNYNITEDLLYRINNIETDSKNFVSWMKYISEPSNNINNIYINESVCNKTESQNIGIAYRMFSGETYEQENNDIPLYISIFQIIINDLKKEEESPLLSNEMIYYQNYFFELIFSEKIPISDEYKVEKEWTNLMNKIDEFNDNVDNIGNRFYYLIKNFVLSINKTQTSLYEKGLEEINRTEYEGTILNISQIIEMYNETYLDKSIVFSDFEKIINNFKDLKETKKINIFIGNETKT